MKNDRVKFQLSDTESPTWTINEVVMVDKKSQELSHQLKKSDDTMHPQLAKRNQLTLIERPSKK